MKTTIKSNDDTTIPESHKEKAKTARPGRPAIVMEEEKVAGGTNYTFKDNDIKIGTKEEAYWTEIKKKTETEIATLEKMLKFNKAILEMVKEKIKNET